MSEWDGGCHAMVLSNLSGHWQRSTVVREARPISSRPAAFSGDVAVGEGGRQVGGGAVTTSAPRCRIAAATRAASSSARSAAAAR